MMGADYCRMRKYEDYNRQFGIPNIGVGRGSVIRNAESSTRTPTSEMNNVRILNRRDRISHLDGPRATTFAMGS